LKDVIPTHTYIYTNIPVHQMTALFPIHFYVISMVIH